MKPAGDTEASERRSQITGLRYHVWEPALWLVGKSNAASISLDSSEETAGNPEADLLGHFSGPDVSHQ